MVKFMKKIILTLILITFITCGCIFAKENKTSKNLAYLMDYPMYTNITQDNISSIKIIRYTEAGATNKIITDKTEITKLYNHFKRVKISDKSDMSCTDNTTVYVFMLADGSKAAIEIECDWIVINGKNYNFVVSQN